MFHGCVLSPNYSALIQIALICRQKYTLSFASDQQDLYQKVAVSWWKLRKYTNYLQQLGAKKKSKEPTRRDKIHYN